MALANEILDQAIRRLNEIVAATPIRWTRSELLVFLNEGVNELNLLAGDIQRTVDLTIDNTENVWDLPAGTIAPLSVRVDNSYLHRESVNQLDNEADWESPTAVRMNPRTWCPFGCYKVLIYPRPILTRTAYVEILQEHTPVTDAAVELPVRPEYQRALEDYVVSRAMFKEGGAEFQQGLLCYERFLDAVQQLSGRNVLRSYPSWDVKPETRVSETTLREAAEPQGSGGQ